MSLGSKLRTAWQLVLALCFVCFVVWAVYAVGESAWRWSISWFDRVDYEQEPEQLAAVIEEAAGCKPCDVHSIEFSDHELTFIVRRQGGQHAEYKLRDKYVRRSRVQPHLQGDLRFFDPRSVDPAILRKLVLEARAADGDESPLRLEKRWHPEDAVCFSGERFERAVDGVSPCPKPR